MQTKSTRLWALGCISVLVISTLGTQVEVKASTIAWKPSLQAALQEAKKTNKPILVDFWAKWCSPCRAMDKRTYTDFSVIRESRKWVTVKVDIDANPKVAARYGLQTPPMAMFLDSNGAPVNKVVGFVDAPTLLKHMRAAYAKTRRP